MSLNLRDQKAEESEKKNVGFQSCLTERNAENFDSAGCEKFEKMKPGRPFEHPGGILWSE